MKRRDFITLIGAAAAAWPLAARAQQPALPVRRVGVLSQPLIGSDYEVQKLIYEELQKLGWIEGRNLRLDYRFGAAEPDMRATAADLVRLAPDVIFTPSAAAFYAVQQETRTIPIVFLLGDAAGRVKNIARPEGNATGVAAAFNSLGGKWLELLKEAAPNVTRVAFLVPPGPLAQTVPSAEAAASALRVQLFTIPVNDVADIRAAIERFAAESNGGLILGRGLPLELQREFIRLAEQYRMPSIIGPRSDRTLMTDRALMSYSSDTLDLLRQSIAYVDRILRGAKPSDLPVQYPTKFELTVNLKTAKAIGLTIPESFLLRADEVIE
jgi:putative ABC transport system substrate-binding protein